MPPFDNPSQDPIARRSGDSRRRRKQQRRAAAAARSAAAGRPGSTRRVPPASGTVRQRAILTDYGWCLETNTVSADRRRLPRHRAVTLHSGRLLAADSPYLVEVDGMFYHRENLPFHLGVCRLSDEVHHQDNLFWMIGQEWYGPVHVRFRESAILIEGNYYQNAAAAEAQGYEYLPEFGVWSSSPEACRQLYSRSLLRFLEVNRGLTVCRSLLEATYQPDRPHHITYRRGEETISFMPPGKQQAMNSSGEWERKGRQTCKPGRLPTLLLGEDHGLKGSDIEAFTTAFKAEASRAEYEFLLVAGEDIRSYYHEESYYNQDGEHGTLWTSCMRYGDRQKYLDLYVACPQCRMLVCLKDSAVVGRALVWETNELDVPFMDRVYYYDETVLGKMLGYAREQGWYSRLYQSRDNKTLLNPADRSHYREIVLSVELPRKKYPYYPYMDTFTYLCDGVLYNSPAGEPYYCLDSTKGQGRLVEDY